MLDRAQQACGAKEASCGPGEGLTGLVAKRFSPSLIWDPEVKAYLEAALGADRFSRISTAICTPPLATCVRVNTLKSTREAVAQQLTEEIKQTGWASRMQLHPLLPDAVLVHGTGPHEIDYTAVAGKEVIINRKAGEAVLRGAHVFVPGLLACSSQVERGDLVAVSLALDSEQGRLTIHRGSVAEQVPRQPGSDNLYIGVGRAAMSRKEMFRAPRGAAVIMEQPVFRTLPCNGILRGSIMAQNLPSLVAAHVLAPKPGSRVCDLCAAPGGKSTAMAQLMGDEGLIYALDRSQSKVAQIQSLAAELALTCISAHKMDATKACRDLLPPVQTSENQVQQRLAPGKSIAQRGDQESDCGAVDLPSCGKVEGVPLTGQEKIDARKRRKAAAAISKGQQPPKIPVPPAAAIEAFPSGSFPYVLLDAPCSALGLRPRLQQRATMSLLAATAAYQRRMLQTAVALLEPGGFLVYSTCTINPGENEANVRFVLDNHTEMVLAPQRPVLGGPGLTGSSPLGKEQWLSAAEAELVQRFEPEGDTIGFFIAKFRKLPSVSDS